jgi:hypothetical protein
MSEQFDEPLDARVPEAFVVPEPIVGALERPRVDAAIVDASAHGTFHKTSPLEGLDVLRRCGERHLVRRRELADGLLAFREPLEHGPARVVTEGAEDEVESVRTFNHIIEYSRAPTIVNPSVECPSLRLAPSYS